MQRLVKCKTCGRKFLTNNPKRKTCPGCVTRSQKEESIRPLTTETPYLVWMWHSKGDSFADIALALGRTVANVKEAYRQYVQSKEVVQK